VSGKCSAVPFDCKTKISAKSRWLWCYLSTKRYELMRIYIKLNGMQLSQAKALKSMGELVVLK